MFRLQHLIVSASAPFFPDCSKMQAMRVLGLDPALAGATGYGVVESDGRSFRTVHFGALAAKRTAPKLRAPNGNGRAADISGRLREIHTRVAALMDDYQPDAVALESVFTALNMRTALALAEVRGVILLAAAERNLPVHSYSPREVKCSVAGYGNADKQQMQQMVRAQLGLEQAPQPADAADALAVAICHIHSAQAADRFAAATGMPKLENRNSKIGLRRSRETTPAAARIQPAR